MYDKEDVAFFMYSIPVKQEVAGWTIDLGDFPDGITTLPDLDKTNSNKFAENSLESGSYANIVYILDHANKKVSSIELLPSENKTIASLAEKKGVDSAGNKYTASDAGVISADT